MMKMISSVKKCTLLLVFALLLVSCAPNNKTVSKEAEKVIDAMMTCPNPELYDADNHSVIGEGVEVSDEKREQIAKRDTEIFKNWEKAVGEYFDDTGLENFYGKAAMMYLAEAKQDDIEIKVKDKALLEKSELTEKVRVTLLKGESEKEVIVEFQYDADGRISDVKVNEK